MTADLRAALQSSLGPAFVLGRELGGGGMSRVFVAEDDALRRQIVVKVLPEEMAVELSLARFQREITLAARLQHPHIVPLLSTGDANGLPYYTMPFIDGETLRDRLARVGELPVPECIRLLREIASAIAYAHERGVVHRDIKPENVLLSGNVALVTDFGVAKALIDATTSGRGPLTSAGIAIGTPAYMSPEQITADPNVDHRSDVYALGMIAYEMLAGQSPFAGRSVQALLAAHVVDAPDDIQKRRPSVPPALASLIMRCLAKRPADRPQNAGEVVQTLDAISGTLNSSNTIVAAAAPWSRGKRLVAVAIGALLLMAAGFGVWTLNRKSNIAPAKTSARLLIVPFENLTNDKRFENIGRIVADRLSLGISQRSAMDVVPSNTVLMAMRETNSVTAEQIERLSTATHASWVVSGSIVLRRDSLVMQSQVIDQRTGKGVVPPETMVGPASDPMIAADLLADRLLGALSSREYPILSQSYRAPSYAAYTAFSDGFERFAVFGDNLGSRPFFERAIALDTNYARAYQLLARQYMNAGEYAKAESLTTHMQHLPLGLNSTEQLQLDYMQAELKGDIAGMRGAQQHLVERDSSALALMLLGEASMSSMRIASAISALERSEPAFLLMGGAATRGHNGLMTYAYHLNGKYDRELHAIEARVADYPDITDYRSIKLRALAGLKRSAPATALIDTMLQTRDDSTGALLGRIVSAAQEFRVHGDAATADRILKRERDWITAHPQSAPAVRRLLAEGMVFYASGAFDSSAVRFRSAMRDTTRIDAAGYYALSLLARGDKEQARAIADSLGSLKRRWMFGENTFWRAAILGALGEKDAAVQLLKQSHLEGQQMQTWHSATNLEALRGFAPFALLMQPQP